VSFTTARVFAVVFAVVLSQTVALAQSSLPRTASSLSTSTTQVRDWENRLLANDPAVRATALAHLARMGRRAFPLLRRLLDAEREDVHAVAFQVIRNRSTNPILTDRA
jgi:hypothetical protein